jgi:hypothetical protein
MSRADDDRGDVFDGPAPLRPALAAYTTWTVTFTGLVMTS